MKMKNGLLERKGIIYYEGEDISSWRFKEDLKEIDNFKSGSVYNELERK